MEASVVAPQKSAIPVTILCVALIGVGSMVMPVAAPLECSSSSKVVDIISVDSPNANIKLENGQIITVKEAKLKIGDNYCLFYSINN
jgi:hypothetical protein